MIDVEEVCDLVAQFAQTMPEWLDTILAILFRKVIHIVLDRIMDRGAIREDNFLDVRAFTLLPLYLGTVNDGVERLFGEDTEVCVFLDILKLYFTAKNVLTEGVVLREEFLRNLCTKLLVLLHL